MSQVDLLKALIDGKEIRNKDTKATYYVQDNKVFIRYGMLGASPTVLFANFQNFEIVKKKIKKYRWVLQKNINNIYIITAASYATEEDVLLGYPSNAYRIISRVDETMIEVEVD